MKWRIPLFKIHWDNADIASVNRVIKRGNYWTTGPEIAKLEEKIAGYIGTKYALSFNSGTSALHALMLAHGLVNCEVIVPSFTFISTANSVILAQSKPVFAEIEDESYGLNPEDVKEKITSKTKAIMPIHYAGGVCKHIKALKEIAEDKNLLLIEDAAESLGAKIDNSKVGSIGNSSMISFCQNKIVTGGEGGVILSNSKEIIDRLTLIRSHGRVEKKEDFFSTTKPLDYVQVGYNLRMSSITASLVISQLEKINKLIYTRNKKAKYYNEKLSKTPGLSIPKITPNSTHVYQMYTVQFENNSLREEVKNHLENKRIMSKIYFEPVHLKTYYKKNYGYKKGDLPITEEISKKVLSLPIYPDITNSDIDFVVSTIKEICR
jgi:dTDP-4-amino-4,6-dideoxygalactose transaminase